MVSVEDKNNKHFHTMATIKNRWNVIWKIKDEKGNWYEDPEGITQQALDNSIKRFKSTVSIIQSW